MTTVPGKKAPVLVVDLDGTLLKSDLLLESLVVYVLPAPWKTLQVLAWLLKGGKPFLKANLAQRVILDGIVFPWNGAVVEKCERAAASGTEVVVATASNEKAARDLTKHFPFISRVIGSDESHNLKAEAKAERLVSEYGVNGFDYIADSPADLPVWKACRHGWFRGSEGNRRRLSEKSGRNLEAIPDGGKGVYLSFLKTFRPHQWLKNILVFVPLLAAHHWGSPEYWLNVLPVFFGLCCIASASYLLNDLLDLDADRRHPTKKYRPFASGDSSIFSGILIALCLFLIGAALSALSGPASLLAVMVYFCLSCLYSLFIKSMAVFDVVFLSSLYTYRIILGGIAAAVFVSPWLLAFSTTFFLGLAFLKRYVELDEFSPVQAANIPGRGYAKGDLVFVLVSGIASSFLSVVVLALYLDSSTSSELYHSPHVLWGMGLILLFWIIRVWFLAGRRKMDADPVWFAAKDPVTYFLAIIGVALIAAAGPL